MLRQSTEKSIELIIGQCDNVREQLFIIINRIFLLNNIAYNFLKVLKNVLDKILLHKI